MKKSEVMKKILRQVKQEVDRWPSWMKTNEVKETIRQSGDPPQKLAENHIAKEKDKGDE